MKSHHNHLHSSFTSDNNNSIIHLNYNHRFTKNMAISPQTFPTTKRPPSESSFISPNLTNFSLLHSLLHLTYQIGSLNAAPWCRFLLNKTSSSTIRKTQLLGVVFEELIRNSSSISISTTLCSNSFVLCLEEMYIVLHRIKTLIEDCSNGSKLSVLMQIETVADNFNKLTGELSTLLDVFPIQQFSLNDDVLEIVHLIRKQCSESKLLLGEEQVNLRNDVVSVLEGIKREIVPSQEKLSSIFEKLEIRDSSSCRSEIENLQQEIQNRSEEQSKSEIVALIGLVRYTKCVLFGASTPSTRNETLRRNQSLDVVVPADYRCPISLELIRDPVVVATGQTYDRASIKLWIESGHNTCPKTGQSLTHTDLIPNHALRNVIALWCREQKIPFEDETVTVKINGGVTNKTAFEATRMTALFLVNKLTLTNGSFVSGSQTLEDTNAVVYELRVLAKTDSESRACIAEAGAIELLVRFLSYEVGSQHPSLQVNAVTTILNLSILEANKTRIMESDGALNGITEVLRSGATWEAKSNAAATVFSLTGVVAFRKRLGRKTRVVSGLVELAKCGPEGAKRDALAAILNLASDRETVARLVESGAVQMTAEIMTGMPEEAVTILEAVVKRGGLVAVAAAFMGIKKLGKVLREGSERARESAAATLVTMCRKGGSEIVTELAAIHGVERVIWELMAVGSVRGRRKAATLLRILRRWAAGLDGGETEGFSTTNASSVSASTTVVVPTTTSSAQ
ncbi:U-box domain-containing protein 16 [Lathyrus oleraceus]|uniref:RING-type E3 ubiquitin transferase n=1 Tax=Pisum sativum TaxID=3888 RepID=A0A9D5A0X1_PEA|nr:U-box domain-containing protein 16 [Pisum sativum]KAI5391431.1 U-box domain-containing protein 16 [Pisum sativum]